MGPEIFSLKATQNGGIIWLRYNITHFIVGIRTFHAEMPFQIEVIVLKAKQWIIAIIFCSLCYINVVHFCYSTSNDVRSPTLIYRIPELQLDGVRNSCRHNRITVSHPVNTVTSIQAFLRMRDTRSTAPYLSLIHIWRCRRSTLCRSRWSPYH